MMSAERNYEDFEGISEINDDNFHIKMSGNKLYPEDIEYYSCSKNMLKIDIEIYDIESNILLSESELLVNILE